MFKNLLLGFLLVTNSLGFKLETAKIQVQEKFFPFDSHNDVFINPIESSNLQENSFLESVDLDNSNHFLEGIKTAIALKEKAIGKYVVMKVSAFLPNFDTIGHNILHANNEFVSKILLDTNLPDQIKKDLILFSIKMAQNGDDFGSYLLQMYYDIVNNSL
jgi:acetate kinase